MKKLLLSSFVGIALLAGCSSEKPSNAAETPAPTVSPVDKPSSTPAATPKPSEAPTPAPVAFAEEYTAGDFKITKVSIKKRTVSWVLTGKVENAGKKDFENVFLSAIVYDQSGERLGIAKGMITGLNKGENKTVEFISNDPLDNYAKLEFQVDSTY